jgi:hypothetical protein
VDISGGDPELMHVVASLPFLYLTTKKADEPMFTRHLTHLVNLCFPSFISSILDTEIVAVLVPPGLPTAHLVNANSITIPHLDPVNVTNTCHHHY